jgi:hypothetical protein
MLSNISAKQIAMRRGVKKLWFHNIARVPLKLLLEDNKEFFYVENTFLPRKRQRVNYDVQTVKSFSQYFSSLFCRQQIGSR